MADELLTSRLLDGERILWSGRPRQGMLLIRRDILLIPLSLYWCGLAFFFVFLFIRLPQRKYDWLMVGGFTTLVGGYFLVWRFFVDAWIRRGMRYAVTNQRVLIARPAPFREFTSLSLEQLPEPILEERANGVGTIRFGKPPPIRVGSWRPDYNGGDLIIWTASLDPTPQFLAINDARRVFDLIQRTAGKQL